MRQRQGKLTKCDLEDSNLDGRPDRETVKRVGHLSTPRHHEGSNAAKSSVDEDGATELIDVSVVDHVTATVVLVEGAYVDHGLVQAPNERKRKEDEAKVVEDVSGDPVKLMLCAGDGGRGELLRCGTVCHASRCAALLTRHKVVPQRVHDDGNGSRSDDEEVLVENRLCRRWATLGCVGWPLLVRDLWAKVSRRDELPQVALARWLELPCAAKRTRRSIRDSYATQRASTHVLGRTP